MEHTIRVRVPYCLAYSIPKLPTRSSHTNWVNGFIIRKLKDTLGVMLATLRCLCTLKLK